MRLRRVLISACALAVITTAAVQAHDPPSAAVPALALTSTSRATPNPWAGDYSPVAAVLHARDVYVWTAADNAQREADALAAADAARISARIHAREYSRRVAPAAVEPEADVAPESGSIEDAILAVFGSDRAVRIARCESTMNPHATNGEHRGLFQIAVRIHADLIASMGFTADQMWQVGPNLAVAKALYDDAGGWGPWQCRG